MAILMAIVVARRHFRSGNRLCSHAFGWLAKALTVAALSAQVLAAETSLTENQVKSLFLLNFAKYVDWPSNAFEDANAPILIGVIGEAKVSADLAKTIAGKQVDGRPIQIRSIQSPEDWDQCHILFIGPGERATAVDILKRLKARPVLTVAEVDSFLEQGGMIKFVKKEGKVRLEINLEPARASGLQISSKLLAVADVVKGK